MREERGDLADESRKHMVDHLKVPAPCTLRSLPQAVRLCSFLLRMKGLYKQSRFVHHPISLPTIRFLVVLEELDHLPGGERRLGEVL